MDPIISRSAAVVDVAVHPIGRLYMAAVTASSSASPDTVTLTPRVVLVKIGR